MARNISAWQRITICLFLVSSEIVLPAAQTANPSPVFVYVKTDAAKIFIKTVGQSDWKEIQKFAHLFSGDSLKIPESTTILLSDGSTAWKEFTGPRAMIIPKQEKNKGSLANFVENLFAMFLKEPHRRFSQEGVRNTETLLLVMPDTVFALAMPDSFSWIKSAPWRTAYRVQIIHDQKTKADTLVRGNTFKLSANAQRWQLSGSYQVKVTLPQSPLLGSEADSSVIHVLQASQGTQVKSQLEKLKKRAEQRGRIEDYFELANFCLSEKLNLELEHHLIAMVRKFPDHPEPKVMLFAYYFPFLSEDIAQRLAMDRLKKLR